MLKANRCCVTYYIAPGKPKQQINEQNLCNIKTRSFPSNTHKDESVWTLLPWFPQVHVIFVIEGSVKWPELQDQNGQFERSFTRNLVPESLRTISTRKFGVNMPHWGHKSSMTGTRDKIDLRTLELEDDLRPPTPPTIHCVNLVPTLL